MKIGLVLPGGGARGAYQVGVWKAMAEVGIASEISVISGISVGAINAALFTAKDAERATELWGDLNFFNIMEINSEKIANHIVDILYEHKSFKKKIASLLTDEGYISRKRLANMMDKYLDYEKIAHSKKRIYIACTNVTGVPNGEVLLSTLGIPVGEVEYMMLNEKNREEIKNVLLASSSIPFVFDKTRINNNHYYDGGISEAIPIGPVYDSGCDLIYVIGLNKKQRIEENNYPGAKILNITLDENYKSVIPPSLSFTPELIRKRIKQGYKDAIKILKKK